MKYVESLIKFLNTENTSKGCQRAFDTVNTTNHITNRCKVSNSCDTCLFSHSINADIRRSLLTDEIHKFFSDFDKSQ